MRHEQLPIKERARGRWQGILPAIGLSAQHLTGKHGACPICKGGKDRFRFDDKNGEGTYICSHCGAGDGVKLAMETQGWDFKEAVQQIEEHIGSSPFIMSKPAPTDEQKRKALRALWKRSGPVVEGDPVSKYLRGRGIDMNPPADLLTALNCRYQGDSVSHHRAMLAMIRDVAGKPTSLHRTYLTNDGHKADVESVRRLMPGKLEPGCAVRLTPVAETLGIAEGIETAMSATILTGVPCWAALNTSLLELWELPEGVKKVVIFADNDANFAGEKAAYQLAFKLVSKRRGVVQEIKVPETTGWDWNDVLIQRKQGRG